MFTKRFSFVELFIFVTASSVQTAIWIQVFSK